jgi:hypothetical protein
MLVLNIIIYYIQSHFLLSYNETYERILCVVSYANKPVHDVISKLEREQPVQPNMNAQ